MQRQRFFKEKMKGVSFSDVHNLLFQFIFGTTFESVFSSSSENIKNFLAKHNLSLKLFLLLPPSEKNKACFFINNSKFTKYESIEWKNIAFGVPHFRWHCNEEEWYVFQECDLGYIQCIFVDGGKIECTNKDDSWIIEIEVPMELNQVRDTDYYRHYLNIFDKKDKKPEYFLRMPLPYQSE